MKYDSDSEVAKERARVMLALINEGKRMSDVARLYEISRQRVDQILDHHFPGWNKSKRPS